MTSFELKTLNSKLRAGLVAFVPLLAIAIRQKRYKDTVTLPLSDSKLSKNAYCLAWKKITFLRKCYL